MSQNNERIEKLKSILADETISQIVKDSAQKELSRLESQGAVAVQAQHQGVTLDPNALVILQAIEKALGEGGKGGGSVSPDEVRKEIQEYLKNHKISESDLSDQLRALIASSKKIELVITQISGTKSIASTNSKFVQLPLTQNLLSDMRARNNSYLYGGAGTGKTFMAEEIASMLGWTLITINCSQYTSPLDILGGQTIEGYQEGRLSQAWSNIVYDATGASKKVDGCVLLLDELPKIDPNTAGLLNDALAKVKPSKMDVITKLPIMPQIRNGRGDMLSLGNLYVIATGNVPLNTIDPDYEANFKQDLSLQDRFVGATYRVKIDYNYEANVIMNGYAFIWIFLAKIRLAIANNKATAQAFVSLRIMINARDTYRTYREVLNEIADDSSNSIISNPKSLITTFDTFFDLFKPSTKEAIISEVNYEEFKRVLASKDKMKYHGSNSDKANDFDTPAEKQEVERLIELQKSTL